jgi:hypothetical protein
MNILNYLFAHGILNGESEDTLKPNLLPLFIDPYVMDAIKKFKVDNDFE